MKSARVTYLCLFSYLLSSLLIWNKSCVAQSVESSSRVDNHNSLEQHEEYIVPGNANKSSLRSLQQSAGYNYPCNFSRYCAGWNGACPFCGKLPTPKYSVPKAFRVELLKILLFPDSSYVQWIISACPPLLQVRISKWLWAAVIQSCFVD